MTNPKRRSLAFARALTTEQKLNHARSRSQSLGYDIRQVRTAWRLSAQGFGEMLGMGMLGALAVERWELGVEKPPTYVEVWVLHQREGLKWFRRLSQGRWVSPFSEGYVRRLAALRRLGPVVCGWDYFERQRRQKAQK